MPPRSKRNAASRRHHAPSPAQSPYIEAPDLLSFDSDAPQQTTYNSSAPAVFDLEPPPSDPEAGRASAAIRDVHLLDAPYTKHSHTYARNEAEPEREQQHYQQQTYLQPFGPGSGASRRPFAAHEGASESDIDDGGPASPSTSPPGPSSFSTGNFALADADAPSLSPARSGIAQLAAADDTTSDDSSLGKSVGHVRAPILAR